MKTILHPQMATVGRAALALLLAAGGPASLHAGTVDKNPGKAAILPPAESHPMYLGTITAGVKSSDVYTEGNFSIVAPVWSSLGAESTLSGGVLFLEPYTSYGEGGEIAASLGLGYRYLFGSQPVSALSRYDAPQAGFFEEGFFIGANAFIDMLDTQFNNQFWQLGVGVEFGTRYLEFRGNYYIPLSDRQLAEQFSTRDTLQSSSTSRSQSLTPLSDPYATGYTIAQDALYTTRATTTTRTTTIDRLFSRYEEGMEGWDAEAALLVPGLDQYFDLRLIGGYYSFDNQPFGPQTGGTGNVEGWKAGVEIRPVPAIILTGTWYEDDRLTGSDWTAGVQLQLPFEVGDLGDGKGFWGRMGDAFKSRRRHLAERMAEPVHRQNAAIKLAHNVELDKETTSTKTKSETKVISQRQTMIVLLNDVVFVNNEGPVGNGIQAGDTLGNGADGTAERPFDTITEGAVLAGNNSNSTSRLWNVYTQGTGSEYNNDVILAGSTSFISSFNPIVGLGGRNFGGNTARPDVDGGFVAQDEDIETFMIKGYTIYDGFQDDFDTIFAQNVRNLVVTDNVIDDAEDTGVDILIDTAGVFNALITDNRFTGGSEEAVEAGIESSATLNLVVLNNEFFGNSYDDGIIIESNGTGTVNALIQDNEFDGLYENGLLITSRGDSRINLALRDNTFAGDFDDAVAEFNAEQDSFMDLTITGNRLLAGTDYSDGFDLETTDDSTLMALVQDNSFLGENDDTMVEMIASDSSTLTANVLDNRFGGSSADETIDIETSNTAVVTAVISNNTFPGDLYQVLDVEKDDRSIVDLTFTGNTLNGSYDDNAFELTATGENGGGSRLEAVFENNLLNGSFNSGAFYLDKYDSALMDVTITGNRFDAYFPNTAIYAYAGGTEGPNDRLILSLTNNQFRGEYDAQALEMYAYDDAKLDATITDNIFEGDFSGDVMILQARDTSRIEATIADNLMRNVATASGAFLYLGSFEDSNLIIQGFDRNLVRGEVIYGLYMDERDTGRIRVDGTLNPAATNEVIDAITDVLFVPNNPPAGSFFMNGVQVDLP